MTRRHLETVRKILKAHKQWIENPLEGKRADLSGADLRGADLRSADLRGAILEGVDLSLTDTDGALF